MPNVHQVIDQLPPDLQEEVSDFALFLLEKQGKQKPQKKKPSFSWEGALKTAYPQTSSVDLQHEILQTRSGLY
jgi:hypothetical protein